MRLSIVFAVILLAAGLPAAAFAEDEDSQRLCPLLSADLVRKILPEVKGHGACQASCQGCGCKGGPGYRGPDGRCVGYADILSKCGPPPHARCRKECAIVTPGCPGRVWVKAIAAGAGLAVTFVDADPEDEADSPRVRTQEQPAH